MDANTTALPSSDVGVATDFVIKLVQLGFIGLAGLLFVLVFLILWRNQTADEGMARFRMAFLVVGFLSVVLAAGVQLMPSRATTSVTFSPDFAEAGLTPPEVRLLPGGAHVDADQEFSLSSNRTISIRTDRLIKEASELRTTVKQLAQATSQLAGSDPVTGPEAAQLNQLSIEVTESIDIGDFEAAADAAESLSTTAGEIAN